MRAMRALSKFVKNTAVILGIFVIGTSVRAQVAANNYKQTNLVADTAAASPAPMHVDPNLLNPWGIAFFPNNPFWISDNNSGFSTLYDQTGTLNGTFTIPPPAGSTAAATPTGIVANVSSTGFEVGGQPSLFIFDTEDGTISGWNGGANVILAVDNSMGGTGAVYKG
ncbi:MAG: TIGR03118 family protein, partial [Candidatus Acidiferrales bacterium]